MNSANFNKNLPIPNLTLKNRGSEMIGKKSKNRHDRRDRRSDLAALLFAVYYYFSLPNTVYAIIFAYSYFRGFGQVR